jgi:diguanylate cyclase (GGDEF)-like protein
MIRITRILLAKPALVILSGISISVAMTCITAVSLYEMRRDAMQQARDASENLTLSLQKDIERNLDIYERAIHQVVSSMETPYSLQLTPYARWLLALSAADNVKELGPIFAADSAGNGVFNSPLTLPPKFNVRDRDYFQVHQQQQGKGLYISKPFLPRAGNVGQPSIAMSVRMDDTNGRFAGIVAGTLKLSYLRELFEGSILGGHGTLTLLRTDGTVLMRHPYQQDQIGSTLAGGHSFPPLVAADHGTYIDFAVLDHVERLYSFRRVGKYPLIVVVGFATDDIYHGWRKRAFAIGSVTAVLDMLTIMLSLLFSGQLRARLAMEKQLRTLAWFDTLTGLPNRARLNREALRILTDASRHASPFAVLFIDLDRFKRVNDTQGHSAGDQVLEEIARRLREHIFGRDVIGRLGGDEFLAVLRDCDASKAARIAQAVLQALSEPVVFNTGYETTITLSASIGISLYPQDAQDTDELLRRADMAMYQAKNSGRNQVRFYAPLYEREAKEQLELEIALRRALHRGALCVAYQPKIDVTGALHGVEALARWSDDKLGSVPPDRFISIAEEIGLIAELDAWVLKEACRQFAEWRAAGIDLPNISVNVCAADFKSSQYPEFIAMTLQSHGLDPGMLTLEMTERVIFDESSEDIHRALNTLHSLGVALSIDDFGTGYSSLSYLHKFPVKEIKIDKSFVQDIGDDAMAESLTQTVIRIGESLNLTVVAEGVETCAQRDFLQRHGCVVYQGYLFSRPLVPEDFVRWVKAHKEQDAVSLFGQTPLPFA